MDHIKPTYIDLGVDLGTSMQNTTCFGEIIFICNKQHLTNI